MQNKKSLFRRGINKIYRMVNPEKQFYADLFIDNEDWNKREPNGEELKRWHIIEKFVQRALAADKPNTENHILDIGCGRGWLSNLLSRYGTVKGLEPVGNVVKHANKLFPELDIKTGTTKNIISTHQQYFDMVVCSEVIEHVPDNRKKDFVKDITTLSKADGYLIITTPRKEAQEEWMKYQSPGQPVEEWMTEKEVEELFQNHNWKTIQKDRFSNQPKINGPDIEIYQLWLFKKVV